MKKSELKSIIKECVKEILFEEGVLSNLVAEVAYGLAKVQAPIVEAKNQTSASNNAAIQEAREQEEEARRKKLLETKRKMLDAMGSSKMANVFEGTEPLKAGSVDGSHAHGPMANRDPNDAGVDISGLFSLAGQKWNALK